MRPWYFSEVELTILRLNYAVRTQNMDVYRNSLMKLATLADEHADVRMPLIRDFQIVSVLRHSIGTSNSSGTRRLGLLLLKALSKSDASVQAINELDSGVFDLVCHSLSSERGSVVVETVWTIFTISNSNKMLLIDLPGLVPSLSKIAADPLHEARTAAIVTLTRLSNSPETASRLVTDTALTEVVIEIVSQAQFINMTTNAITYLGNLVHWCSEDDRELILQGPILDILRKLSNSGGCVGLVAQKSLAILSPPTTLDTQFLDMLLDFLRHVLEDGRAYGFLWALTEPLFPLFRTCVPPASLQPDARITTLLNNPNLRYVATPEVVRTLTQVLETSRDAWAIDLTLDLLLCFCDLHQADHATHTKPQPSCLVCLSRKSHMDLGGLHSALSHVKRAFANNSSLFGKARKLLVVATEDSDRWTAFCMGKHPRLGKTSPVQFLPSHVLPNILDYL
eukprot:c9298_g1_i1.p1 GENE.c9298_g1_i1~~c9298_g1_i1.p1  ORF type:complete len:452 (+),score=88.76 c9298_g1_i1:52-1407(+)